MAKMVKITKIKSQFFEIGKNELISGTKNARTELYNQIRFQNKQHSLRNSKVAKNWPILK